MELIKKIQSGDKELLTSGTFLTFDNKDVIITICFSGEEIKIHFRFINNESEKDKLNVNFEVINSQELRVIFQNYNNSLGQFNTVPIELGSIANRELFMSYYIIHLNETDRKQINYSFYVGKEVNNG